MQRAAKVSGIPFLKTPCVLDLIIAGLPFIFIVFSVCQKFSEVHPSLLGVTPWKVYRANLSVIVSANIEDV
jgi:hypothetical protein